MGVQTSMVLFRYGSPSVPDRFYPVMYRWRYGRYRTLKKKSRMEGMGGRLLVVFIKLMVGRMIHLSCVCFDELPDRQALDKRFSMPFWCLVPFSNNKKKRPSFISFSTDIPILLITLSSLWPDRVLFIVWPSYRGRMDALFH